MDGNTATELMTMDEPGLNIEVGDRVNAAPTAFGNYLLFHPSINIRGVNETLQASLVHMAQLTGAKDTLAHLGKTFYSLGNFAKIMISYMQAYNLNQVLDTPIVISLSNDPFFDLDCDFLPCILS